MMSVAKIWCCSVAQGRPRAHSAGLHFDLSGEVLKHRTRFHTVTLFLRANLHVGRKLHFQKAVTECRFRNPAGAGLHPLSRLK